MGTGFDDELWGWDLNQNLCLSQCTMLLYDLRAGYPSQPPANMLTKSAQTQNPYSLQHFTWGWVGEGGGRRALLYVMLNHAEYHLFIMTWGLLD